MVLDSFFNFVFGWAITIDPAFGLILISLIFTFLVTLAYKYFTDQTLMKQLKEDLKKLRKEMKDFKDNPEKMIDIQKKSFEKSMQQMKMQFKPMLITLIPLLLLFSWLRVTYQDTGDVLFGLSWLWIYILTSIIFSLILRKVLQVH